MDLHELLQPYQNVEECKMQYIENMLVYYKAEYYVNDNRFLKYYVLDLTKEEDIIQWNSMKEFQQFEMQLLENEFFSSTGDERYNIYLIFIVSDTTHILNNIDVQNDFLYARKIILNESDAEDFFITLFPLKRRNGESGLSATGDIRQKEVRLKLQQYAKICIDLLYKEMEIRSFITQLGKKKKNLNILSSEFITSLYMCMNFDNENSKSRNKKGKHVNSLFHLENYDIEKIVSLKVENYRCFKECCEVNFKKVNLLFGDNGVGKTSILDAIELGITGFDKDVDQTEKKKISIEINCQNAKNKIVPLFYSNNNLELSEKWYGIRSENAEKFNKLFNQYNYFDTSWASAFAIEGEEQVNVKQLQEFLGIEDLETNEKYTRILYEKLKDMAEEDQKFLLKYDTQRSKLNFWRKKYLDSSLAKSIAENESVITKCYSNLEKIKKEIEPVKWGDIISEHITKIEKIFKSLVCTDEYTSINVQNEEIVASRSGSGEKVRMSKMSAGQKVCLALAFMFALFLSNESAPNVIMLDEPVANLDDLHMLNLLDLLRRLALSNTQIFFTTANPDVAKMFRRKFSYLEEDFGFYRIVDLEDHVKIAYEQYSQKQDEPTKVVTIYGE